MQKGRKIATPPSLATPGAPRRGTQIISHFDDPHRYHEFMGNTMQNQNASNNAEASDSPSASMAHGDGAALSPAASSDELVGEGRVRNERRPTLNRIDVVFTVIGAIFFVFILLGLFYYYG